jgi:hypothetical protein
MFCLKVILQCRERCLQTPVEPKRNVLSAQSCLLRQDGMVQKRGCVSPDREADRFVVKRSSSIGAEYSTCFEQSKGKTACVGNVAGFPSGIVMNHHDQQHHPKASGHGRHESNVPKDAGRSPRGPKGAPNRIPGQNIDADQANTRHDGSMDADDKGRLHRESDKDDDADDASLSSRNIGAQTPGDPGANLSQPLGDGNYLRIGDADVPLGDDGSNHDE